MSDGRNFFDSSKKKKNDTRTYKNIQRITTGQADYYTTGCFLNYL